MAASHFELVRFPLVVRMLEVLRVATVTPRLRRITLGGRELSGFQSRAPEDHVKLFFPAPGEDVPVVPVVAPFGVPLPLHGKPIARDYTVRRYDEAAGELDIDFVLHDAPGPASDWARSAERGKKLGIAGPRGSRLFQQAVDYQLFIGDETALPEIARRIEESGGLPSFAFVLVEDAAERQVLTLGGAASVTWLHRTELGKEPYREALTGFTRPPGRGMVWLAGEREEVRAVVKQLVELGFDPDFIHRSAHWRRGEANYDHHAPLPD